MLQEFKASPRQIKLVKALGYQAYRDFADEFHFSTISSLHKAGFCDHISQRFIALLRKQGFLALPRYYPTTPNYHCHIDLGNGWRADPTWQQFREPPNDVLEAITARFLPKVLIFQPSSFHNLFSKYNVPLSKLFIWTEAQIGGWDEINNKIDTGALPPHRKWEFKINEIR